MLYNIPEMSVNDLGPYLTMIPFLQHIKLEECVLTKASSLICSSLLGHNTTSQLQSCTLHGNTTKAVVILHDPIRGGTFTLLFKSNYFLIYGYDTSAYRKPYIKRKSIKL
jgi:hypothetical protein